MALTSIIIMANSTRILVTGLSVSASESLMLEQFHKFGEIRHIRLKKSHATTTASALISFAQAESSLNARASLNGKLLFGSRISVCLADCFPIKESNTNIFVKNIPPSVDASQLEELFRCFGKILNSKISYDENNQSRGYGFIMFEKKEEADMAVAKGNNAQVLSSILMVQHFVPKELRVNQYANLYVRGFSEKFSQEELLKVMSAYGEVVSAVTSRNSTGYFGFVCFQRGESAEKAILDLHGKRHSSGFEWFLSRNISKSERIIENKMKVKKNEERLMRTNLYIKNWPSDLNEMQMRSVFGKFGVIESVKILTQECLTLIYSYPLTEIKATGQAFISFQDEKSVDLAIHQMRHTLINNSQLQMFRWVPKSMLFRGNFKKNNSQMLRKPAYCNKSEPVPYFNFDRFREARVEDRKRLFGEAIYQEIFKKYDKWTGKITGMIIELEDSELLHMMENKLLLYAKAKEAMGILNSQLITN